MRGLLLCLVVFLTGCATRLTVISPDVPADLKVRCPDEIARPLTTGDQYDLARALAEAAKYGRDCRARMNELIDAVEVREGVMRSLQKQIGENK